MRKLSFVLILLMINLVCSSFSNKESNLAADKKPGSNIGMNIPVFITEKFPDRKVENASDAKIVINRIKARVGIKSAERELRLLSDSVDVFNTRTCKFQQVYKGVPVFGCILILHTDNRGVTSALSGYYNPSVSDSDIICEPAITREHAVDIAKKLTGLKDAENTEIKSNELMLYNTKDKGFRLSYYIRLSSLEADDVSYWDVILDALDGSCIEKLSHLSALGEEGLGKGVTGEYKRINVDYSNNKYYLNDTVRKLETYDGTGINEDEEEKLPGTLMTDNDNQWYDVSQQSAVDAHFNAARVYDYYMKNFKRDSLDGKGMKIVSTVHFGENFCNAFWNGSQMVYGDGDGKVFTSFSEALDIVGHEMTHAVTENSAELFYAGQSGAIDESVSDVFGNLIENKPDNLWLMGEDIYTPDIKGDALRSMSNPPEYGDPDNMSEYVETDADNGGVHTNSGIPNKAFFLAVQKISRNDAAQIWYRALTQYLTPTSDFSYFRKSTVTAAEDLFGSESQQVKALIGAWDSVGVKDPVDTGIMNDGYEPNDKTSGAFGPLEDNKVYKATISSGNDIDMYYYITGKTGKMTIALTDLPADYSLSLLDDSGGQLATSIHDGTQNETISFVGKANTRYVICVNSVKGLYSEKEYSLKITPEAPYGDEFEPNDSMSTSYNLGLVENTKSYKGTVSYSNDNDWIKFKTVSDWRQVEISLTYDSGEYGIDVFNAEGRGVGSSKKLINPKVIRFAAAPNAYYYIKISSSNGKSNQSKYYSLEVKSTDVPTAIATYPANNSTGFKVNGQVLFLFNKEIAITGSSWQYIEINDDYGNKYDALTFTSGQILVIEPYIGLMEIAQKYGTKGLVAEMFEPDTTYHVKIPGSILVSSKNNTQTNEDFTLNFTTGDGPVKVERLPIITNKDAVTISASSKVNCTYILNTMEKPKDTITGSIMQGESISKAVKLNEGVNNIRIRFNNVTGYYPFKVNRTIILDTVPPAISVNEVPDKVKSKTVEISGVVEKDCKVTVSDKPAEVKGTVFKIKVDLKKGINKLVITAADSAGNITTVTKEIELI